MQKTTLTFCLFFLFLSAIKAQEQLPNTTTQTGVRFHLNVGLFETPIILPFSSDFSNVFGYVAPGITMYWQKERRYTEFGLADWYIKPSKENFFGEKSSMYFSIRFEQGWRINATDNKLQFFIGYGIQPQYGKLTFYAKVGNVSFKENLAFGIQTEFIPKLAFQLSDSWTLDFSVPLMFTDFSIEREYIENPSLLASQRNHTSFDFNIFPGDLSVRLGVSKAF